jgi:hypothetical protein
MKILFIGAVALSAISFSACNGNNDPAKEDTSDSAQAPAQSSNAVIKGNSSIDEIVEDYLRLKNALASDKSNDAATAGSKMQKAIEKIDTASFSAAQKKVFSDVSDDAREHAEHIGMNGGKIAHQREHFETLSKDVYDLVKAFGSGQTLYQDYCPMYNDNKGATWLSETKEIKNPYLGQKMPSCGEVKEEIK